MKVKEINKVCFIGAGTMGCFNSLMAAAAGYQAVVYDLSGTALKQMPAGQKEMADFLVASGFFAADVFPAAFTRITTNSDLLAATADADLISESVSERLDVKRQVHKLLDEICPPTTIITTNTSSLLVSNIEDALVRGDRFAALHSHLGSSLIDIVGGPRTSVDTIDSLWRYVLSIKGVPLLLKKENPGYVLNAMLGPLLTMAMMLVIEGIATKEAIDGAWMLGRKAPIGPFGLMDMFGINIIADSWSEPKPETKKLQVKILGFLSPYLQKNTLGIKTGTGFYSYPQPDYEQPGFLSADADIAFPGQALECVLIENAILIARKDVADPQDIDRAWMTGMGLQKGPFGILDEIGIVEFLNTYIGLVKLGFFSAEAASQVDAYLAPYVASNALGKKKGKGFYSYPNPLFETPGFLQARK